MSRAARLGDIIVGMTSGEHSGHIDGHSPCAINGTITSGSSNVFINALPASRILDTTIEHDCCDNNQKGIIAVGSSRVFINGLNAARIGDILAPHNGEGNVLVSPLNGSPNVYIKG